jgi:O-antigen/teichoic acid export membrane protein
VRGVAGAIRTRLGQDPVRKFGREFSWTLSSRGVAALLQIAILTFLARGLSPAGFAFVASVNVALSVVCTLNGLGINRQISYRRSRDPQDASLPDLFALRLRYTYGSAVLWLVATIALAVAFDDSRWLAVAPASLWLFAEQNTQVWNSIAIVDGRARRMMPSFLLRRLPVVVLLSVALLLDWDIVLTWAVSLALGAMLAYVFQFREQEPWARALLPRRSRSKVNLDLGYWWSQVGEQLRDFDVPVLAAFVSPVVAGIYALPARFVRPMNMITMATGSVAFPQLSRRQTIWRHELFAGVALGSVPTVIMATILFFLAPALPLLVGSEYDGSVAAMQVIAIAAALWGPTSLLVIFMQSRSDEATRAAGATVVTYNCLVLGGVVLGGTLGGATGAAAAAAVGQALTLLTLGVLAMRYAPPRSSAASQDPPSPAPDQAADRAGT